MKPCAHPGCGALVPGGVRHCPKHAKANTQRTNEARPATDRAYGTARWQRLRAHKLQANPLCEMCEGRGAVVPAVLVDHIRPVRDGGAMFDPENLQALCRGCHDLKTADDLQAREVQNRGSKP